MQYKDIFCHLHGCPMALSQTLPFRGSEEGLGKFNVLAGHFSIHFCISEMFLSLPCLCQMPLSKSHCVAQKDWFHTTITVCWLNPSIFRENRKAQMSSDPRQHEVMACLKSVNLKLLHFFSGVLWQVNSARCLRSGRQELKSQSAVRGKSLSHLFPY